MELQGSYSGKIATGLGVNPWTIAPNEVRSSYNVSVDSKVEPVGPLKHLLYRLEQMAITLDMEANEYLCVLWNFKSHDPNAIPPEGTPIQDVNLSDLTFYDRLALAVDKLQKATNKIANCNNDFNKLL